MITPEVIALMWSFLDCRHQCRCRAISRLWCMVGTEADDPRPSTSGDFGSSLADLICERIRRTRLPFPPSTECYIRSANLTPRPNNTATAEMVAVAVVNLYGRSFINPKTNIGTLDTTRVIGPSVFLRCAWGIHSSVYVCIYTRVFRVRGTWDVCQRLTQARLSRFHTTGAASVRPRRCLICFCCLSGG